MPYPSPPWTLHGFAYQTLHLISCDRLKPLLPPEFEVISILPNMTLGGVYLASYGSGSVLQYNELIVAAGLVRRDRNWGAWISHIYVDNLDSVAGGRHIWGLPKEMADFTWESGSGGVSVRQGDRLLCAFRPSWHMPLIRQPFTGFVFSTLGQEILRFNATATANWKVAGAHLTIPPESPFSDLNLGHPRMAIAIESLDLTVNEPKVVGQTKHPATMV
jgi:acetoacetate decarboxylase